MELLINYQNNRYKKLELILNLRKKCICMLFILKFVGKYKYKINKVFLLVLSKLVCYNKALKHIAYYENKWMHTKDLIIYTKDSIINEHLLNIKEHINI